MPSFITDDDTDIHLRPAESNPSPRIKPPPKTSSIPVPFSYFPSDDGTDENLLILLHGLGDTHVPFSKLGRQLNLPQTATLALRAPDQIPFLYEQAFQWYTSFDPLGELLDRPNPTPALDLLLRVLTHLTGECGWPPGRIHLFGFAQGGSVAAEVCILWWRRELQRQKSKEGDPRPLGSLISISGPMLSYPTLSSPCLTPALVFHRAPPSELALPNDALTSFRKAFVSVLEVKKAGDGMPRSKDEWEPLMRFWSEKLERRQGEGLYEVMTSGISRS
ncbi:alpha/beta-hydrolase [Leucogyrophana mollusca]|uniref:Alpha/beta-hydrolase n=1 Tax=Leucogyrophana mollusca TaxID=85980 RepID=A0ACB8B6C2_9AGAM|nr:alpha/beta-hydrolase [Leucogyrophana mollusca]